MSDPNQRVRRLPLLLLLLCGASPETDVLHELGAASWGGFGADAGRSPEFVVLSAVRAEGA